MTSKFTREELLNIIETDHVQCGEASALARMALAVMDSEPVAEVLSNRPGNDTSTIDRALPVGTQLYRHAQPAPEKATVGEMPFLGTSEGAYVRGWNDCRAAMLQDGTLTNEDTNNCREIAETPTGFDNLTFDEHRKYIGLANIEIRRFQTIPDKKYIADLLTIAVNSLYESINTCGEVSSPAIPEGYVMVPKEPTDEMISSGIAAHYNRSQIQIHDRPAPGPMECAYVAMLAAADCSIPMISDRWIPVSERMPETDGNYWGWWSESKRQGPVWFIKSELQAQFQSHEITHWMPLPADPQEQKP